jgi:fibronectin type 3 domain-containing protein
VTTPTTADTTPPSTPTLQQESIASNEIDLGWTVSTDTGTGVSGYKLYRKGPGESTFTLLATQPGAMNTTYPDTTVKPSSTYVYYVTAYDGAALESAHSNTVTSTTPAGPTSKTFTFTTSGDATIQQANPTTTGGSTSPLIVDNSPVDDVMMKFNVATTGCDSLTSAKLTLTDNADPSVKGGDFYTTGSNWTESAVTWSNAPTRGTLLNSLGAVASGATATVDVTPGVTLNGEADFRIGTTTSDGVHYYSKEGAGAKPTLTVVCATSAPAPDTQAPTAPGTLTGNARSSGEVDLSWTASTDNVGVTAYDIYRGGAIVGTVPGGPDQGSSLTYQDTSVSPATTYQYTVKARDAANNPSAASNTATVTTPAASTVPSAPTNLTATATSSTSVNLTWTASNSPNVTGYNIYRGPHAGTLTKINSSGTSPFTDTNAAGTAYDYQVTAVDTSGTESLPSNTASVTTPAPSGGGGGITAGTAAVTKVTTAAATWTVNLPTYAVGDFMVVWLGNNLGSTAGTPASSGWTAQAMTNESSGLKGTFLTRRMAAGDPSSITVTWSGSTLGVAEATGFTGVNATTPVDVKAGQAEASSTAVSSHSTPSVTTTTAGDVLVSGFTTDNGSTWTAADTELADAASGTVSAAVYYSAPVAAGSYSKSATATTASVKAVSTVLALRAA